MFVLYVKTLITVQVVIGNKVQTIFLMLKKGIEALIFHRYIIINNFQNIISIGLMHPPFRLRPKLQRRSRGDALSWTPLRCAEPAEVSLSKGRNEGGGFGGNKTCDWKTRRVLLGKGLWFWRMHPSFSVQPSLRYGHSI